jgi:chemotaxis family two-component system response regulator Rcp1
MIQRQAIEILLVEDNPGDVDLTLKALTDLKIANRISVAVDGEEALAYVRREGRHRHAMRPDLILLDLNIPRMDGREVLDAIKADPALRDIPVVVLTSSTAEHDIVESYRLQADSYVTKPLDLDRFLTVMKSIEPLWLEVVSVTT